MSAEYLWTEEVEPHFRHRDLVRVSQPLTATGSIEFSASNCLLKSLNVRR